MQRLALRALLPVVLMTAALAAVAGEYGTPEEAKAMLENAVAALKADKDQALEMFTKGEGGFKQGDLYPYCGGPDGNFTAHPKLVGESLKDLKDKTGNPFGQEIYEKAQEGEVAEVPYMWPRPGEEEPVQKVAYVTKVDDQVCAVGYYK